MAHTIQYGQAHHTTRLAIFKEVETVLAKYVDANVFVRIEAHALVEDGLLYVSSAPTIQNPFEAKEVRIHIRISAIMVH
jgi:hypothetical protein